MTSLAPGTTASRLLIDDLAKTVGERNVVWKPEDLLLYEYDGSIDRAAPRVVVLPGSAQEAADCVKAANRHDAFIVPRGAGTGLSGGAVPLRDSVVIGLARLSRVLDVDVENRVAIVEPGLVNLELSNHVEQFGLYYAPDPSSQKACTIGGNVAENAGGPHCLALGTTTNHVLGLEVVLADGSLLWLGGPNRESTGYDLRGAFIGSEGTFGVVTKVAVRLLRIPEKIHTILAAFTSLDAASQTVSDIIAAGIVPAALEMMDRVTIDACEPVYHPGYPADAEAVLIVELDGLTEAVAEQSALVESICKSNGASEMREADEPAQRAELWATRKGAIGAFGTIAPSYYLVDGVVPRTKLRQVMREVKAVGDELDLTIGNVFHAGDGNLHPCILFDERVRDEVRKVIQAGERILEICVSHGGALSGEHGIGIEKQAYMPLVFTEADMEAMKGLREAFLNPGHSGSGDDQVSARQRSGDVAGSGGVAHASTEEGSGATVDAEAASVGGLAKGAPAEDSSETAEAEANGAGEIADRAAAESSDRSSAGEPASGPKERAPVSERFNPGKIFPGGAQHGEAYGITEHSVRRLGRGDEV